MATLLYRLHDTLCARREFLARRVGRRAVTRAEMICRSIFQGFLNAEKAQAELSNEDSKEWLLCAKDVCYDLIDVLEEMSFKEPKVAVAALAQRAISLLNLHTTGINKMKRIMYRLALLAAYAESLGLLREVVQGQQEDGQRTPVSGLAFLLIDGNKDLDVLMGFECSVFKVGLIVVLGFEFL
ncbi:hypothetical protein PIB30_092372 [Stylosanthes scabra]|uniref:Uncharacterized protein n=1 Tax=Stylosanthes scabra TaxID=79078 RepID=A0ABU6UUX4_9FABA|nr:hypothetical protein [Stylosanthes scabra]